MKEPVKPSKEESPVPEPIKPISSLELWYKVKSLENSIHAQRLITYELQKVVNNDPIGSKYNVLFLWTSDLDDFELSKIYSSLAGIDKTKSILLMINSPGGSAESAYLISKALRGATQKKFVVAVPRKAKSATTLLSLGADEIHLSPISELGPIDPQINNMPALGMQDALDHICSLAITYPAASSLLATYLEKTMPPENLGYSSRVTEAAKQYAEILLSDKADKLPQGETPSSVGESLVYKYKSHGFVIDRDQASKLLGRKIIKTDTEEVRFALVMHDYIDSAALALSTSFNMAPIISGTINDMLLVKRR